MGIDIEGLLAGLNEPQRDAVEEFSHPLLVLAGAGSGKTRVITTKIAYAVARKGLEPYRILAVTFTNKAAGEMRERVESLLGDKSAASSCVIKTFHGFGAAMLRKYADKAALSPRFAIYDDNDSYELLHKAYPSMDAKELRAQSRRISLCKDKGITPAMVRRQGNAVLAGMYERYEHDLQATGNVDFADLILRPTRLLDDPEVAGWAHGRFRMVLVDEYQDTNACQFQFLKKLVGPDTLVCVVGDDDQSIYRFRGAEVGNIDAFKTTFGRVRVIKLEQNYRSTQGILDLANCVIKKNHAHGDLKKLWTDRKGGKKPLLCYLDNETAEAEWVATRIKQIGDVNHTAVLFRTNAQSGMFENTFTKPQFRIPYKVIGALKFYDREQVKDGLALLYLLVNPRDIVSFRRMVNKPARGLGPGAQAVIEQSIAAEGGDCLEGLRKAQLPARTKPGADKFLEVLDEARGLLDAGKLSEGMGCLFRESGLYAYYEDLDRKEGKQGEEGGRKGDFDTLITQASQYGDGWDALTSFLETLALDPTTVGYLDPREKEGVTLITMHNTKGLEFDYVFVVGLEDGLFPSVMSMEEDPTCDEERRLFYVAVTRARKELYLTSCAWRRRFGETHRNVPSRFLQEIDPGLMDVRDEREDLGETGSWHRGDALYKHGVEGGWHGMDMLEEKRLRRTGMTGGSLLIHKGFAPAPPSRPAEEAGTVFHAGQRVRSQRYGDGTVVRVSAGSGPEVAEVRFDSGKSAKFISKYAKLERI